MLKLKGEYLDTTQDAQTISFVNPAFDSERIERSYSLSYTLPHSPKNLRLLENKTRLDAQDRTVGNASFEFAAGLSQLPGVVYLSQVGATRSSANFRNIPLDIAVKAEKINIRDLCPTIDLGFPGFVYYFDLQLDPVDYPEITVNGTRIVADTIPTAANAATVRQFFIDRINLVIAGIASAVAPGNVRFQIQSNRYIDVTITGVEYLTYTKVNPIAEQVITLFENHFETIANTPVDTHCFPLLHCPNFYEDAMPDFLGFANLAIEDGGTTQLKQNLWYDEGEIRSQNTVIPMVRIRYLLAQIALTVGLDGLSGDFETDAEWNELVIYNNLALDNWKTDIPDAVLEYKTRNIFQPEFDLGNHVPDITARELLNLVASLGFCYTVRENRLRINRINRHLTGPRHNLTSFANFDLSMNITETKGTTIRFIDDRKEAEPPSGQLDNYVIGEGESLVTLPFRPLPEVRVWNDFHNVFVRVCSTSRPGSSPRFDYNDDYPFTFMWARALQPVEQPGATTTKQYLQSASLNIDVFEAANGNYSLNLTGTDGLMEKLLLNYFRYIESEEIQLTAVMPPAEILKYIHFDKPVVHVYHPNGTLTFVLKNIEVTTGTNFAEVAITGHRV